MRAELEHEVAELYGEHASGLLRYAARMAHDADVARDAVQETFLRYCVERRYGREIAKPRAWLFQVMRNHLVTCRKSAACSREVGSGELDGMVGDLPNPEALARQEQRARQIRKSLTARELECLGLRAEGLSYAEIADVLEIRPGTVGALLTRVHQKLRWPPGREGTIGVATAEAVHFLFLGGSPCTTLTLGR
jgi:RNA polymerase sigma-70 factor (ECF subfamily)